MSQFGSAEKLMDPMAISVASGQRANYEVGPCSAVRIKRDPASVGVLRYVVTTFSEDAPGGSTTGYVLTAADPDSGWIPADASRWVRVYADTGAVSGEIARLRRL